MSEDENLASGYRKKLIAQKKKWARDGRLIVPASEGGAHDRLPPGQRLVKDWPVLDLGVQPHIQRSDWSLTIDGLVETPLVLNWDQIMAQPQTKLTTDIHCVTAWSRYDNMWKGVSTLHVCGLAGVKSDARHVILHSYDGYTTNVTLEAFAGDDCLLAHSHDGHYLTRQHGGPLRVVIPRFYFWKSAKWLKRLEFVAGDKPGFWERRGYHAIGDPWSQQRYAGEKPEELFPD